MKNKFFIIILFAICAYGFLPVSLFFDKSDAKKPNYLLIERQECGCPCPNASIKEGKLLIADDTLKKYSQISTKEINISGRNPFVNDLDLTLKQVIVYGKTVGVDSVMCEPSDCELVANFEVYNWKINGYYPRLWIHGSGFLLLFLGSSIFLLLIICKFLLSTVFKFTRRKKYG